VEVLDSPIWIMIVNIVALEMLGDTMPKLGSGPRKERGAVGGSSDEDPYSLTASASSRSGSGKTAPDKSGDLSLDSDSYLPANWALRRQPKEDIEEDEYVTASYPRARDSGRGSSGRDSDPYYSGYSARVPAFVGEQRREQENRREQRASRRDERRYEAPAPRAAPGEQYPAPRDPQGRALGLDPTWLHMKKFQQGQAQPEAGRRESRHLSPLYSRAPRPYKPVWK